MSASTSSSSPEMATGSPSRTTPKRRRRARHVLFAGLAAVGAAEALAWVQPSLLFDVLERLAPGIVWRVKTRERLVGLSFDDGPDPIHTPRVLDILARHGARATFFVVGERARAHPELVARLKGEGHEVANHYLTLGGALLHADAEFLRRLDEAEQAAGISGRPKLFRPPGGIAWPSQLRLARERGYACVLGSAYPRDPVRPPVAYIRWLVAKNLAPGAIVVLHDGISDPSRTIEALPEVLATGAARGFSFVSVGALMASERRAP